MMDEKTVEQSMQLILHSGTGRSAVIEAIQALAKDHDIEKARKAIEAAGQEIGKAHDIQTAMMSAVRTVFQGASVLMPRSFQVRLVLPRM